MHVMKNKFPDHREPSGLTHRPLTGKQASEYIRSQEQEADRFDAFLASARTRSREIEELRADARRPYYAHGYEEGGDTTEESPRNDERFVGEDEFWHYTDDFGPSRLSARRDARLNGVSEPGLRRREEPKYSRLHPLAKYVHEYNSRNKQIHNESKRRADIADERFQRNELSAEDYENERNAIREQRKKNHHALKEAFPESIRKRKTEHFFAYQDARDAARQRGRYPAQKPVEWHREERKQEARWQERAFHSPEDERALEEYFNMRRYEEKGLEAWDQGETETEMLARRKAEHQAELRARLDALDDEWDQAAQETDTTTYREKTDALDQWLQHRPFVTKRMNKQEIVFQSRGPHPANMPKKYNRENRVPGKGNFAPEKKSLDE